MAESRVRIFVSSPADLDHERALIKELITQLAAEYLPYFKLQSVLWEEEVLTAAQSFQAGLSRPSECEIVLVMLWTRLGTPLADDPYGGMTGTEWEFVDAVAASTRVNPPEVLVYKKTTARLIDITDVETTRVAIADRERLDLFFRTHFFNSDGSFSRAFRQFENDRVLRELVQVQLRKLLNRRISAERGRRPGAGEWRDSPFRAHARYELRDEPVFVGRETETRELVACLDRVRGAGRGLVLISGPSGVGKSSLVRAGLLPRLVRPFLFAGIAACRWAVLPAHRTDPLAALSESLLSPDLLGASLSGFGLDAAGLARLLEAEPEVAAGQVRAALARLDTEVGGRAGDTDGHRQLALILDPLDGLLSEAALAAPSTRTFVAALAALAAQDGVWIIATLRSELLYRLPRLPVLAAAVDEGAWYPLDPPPPARIRQVIEIPARVAGIDYEDMDGGPGHGLADLLEAEVSDLTHWPVLLQPVLDDLYTRARAAAVDGGETGLLLRIADYRAAGGVAGSVLRRARACWEGLDAAARAALPMLCRALIALEGGSASRPVPRVGDLRALFRDPGCVGLVQALVAARLVVTEGIFDPAEHLPCAQTDDALFGAVARIARETAEEWRARLLPGRAIKALTEGVAAVAAAPSAESEPQRRDWHDYRPAASFVHPVLIETWAPVRDWLADPANRRDLQLRVQITRQARLWKRTDCNREYLLGEVGHAGARRFADAFARELEPVEQEFLERSLLNLREQRRRNHSMRLIGLTLAVLLVFATATAWWAWEASRAATLNLHRSQLNAADLAINQGNTPAAIRLALDAGRDLAQAATDTLSRAFSANRLIAMAQASGPPSERALSPSFSDDGQQLVTLSLQDGASLWRLEENRFVLARRLSTPALSIHAVRLTDGADPPLILGIGETGVWRLPAADGAAPDWTCGARPGGAIALDGSHRYLALSHPAGGERFGLCVIDTQHLGQPRWDRALHDKEIRGVAFSPDGMRLVTASRDGTALVVESATGDVLVSLPPGGPLDRPVNRAIFDSRGERIAVAAADERVRLYDRDGRELAVLGEVTRQGRKVRIHKTAVRDIAFAAADRYLLAGDDAGQLVRWDLRTGDAEVLGQHRLSVEHVRASPVSDPREAEDLVLTASLDKTARLWGLQGGREVAVFSHDAAVTNARFSVDGHRVLTYSDEDGSARLWSVDPVSALSFPLPHADHVWHLDMARPPPELDTDPGAFLIATGSFDGAVRVWRYDSQAPTAAPAEIWNLRGHRGRVRRVAFSPTGRWLASAAFDGSARVWNLITGGGCTLEAGPPAETESAAGVKRPARVEFYRVLFTPDARWLLTTSNEAARPVRLWDPATCAELPLSPALEHGPDRVQAAAVAVAGSGGTQLFATGDDAGTLRVLRSEPGGAAWTLVCRLDPHGAPITDLAFAPDGRAIASVGEDGRGVLVPLADGVCGTPRFLDAQTEALYSVRFSPDGAVLVTASMDARAQVWDSRGGALIAELKGHKDRIYSAEFSPDGRWIITASRDGALRLWQRPVPPRRTDRQPRTAGSYLVLEADLGGVAYARFSPDGNSVAAAYWENAALLWRIWTNDTTPDPAIVTVWGKDRSRLALIREAMRFRRDNGLGVRVNWEARDAYP